MNKQIKRLVALLLAFCIVSMQLVRDTTTVKAFGAVTTASAIWEALTAASGAYAGYKLTTKQNKTVTQQLASYLTDFADVLIDAPYEHLSSVSDFTSYMVAELVPKNGLLTKTSVEYLTKAFLDQAGNTLEGAKKHAVVLEKNVKKIETAKPTNPQDDDGGGLLPSLLKEIVINIAADGAINAGKKFIKFCGTLTDLIIKDNLNSEYIKGKGKWDWESLGFKTDYDTVNISSSDGSKFKGINDGTGAATARFDYTNTLFEIKDDNNYTHVVYLGCGTEKTAIVTIHDPETDKWLTTLYPEDVIYKQMVDIKAGNINCADLLDYVKNNYYSQFDTSSKNSYDFFELIKVNGIWHQGVVFDSVLFSNTVYYGGPLHIKLNDNFPMNNYLQFNMSKSNTTAYNMGVSANIFYINFSTQTKYTGATTALNGTDTMQPTVKPSKYTNTAEEIDKSSDTIIINNYVVNNYTDTDNVINNIANDNDMHLDTNDDDDGGTTSDYTSLLKSILSTLRNIPKNTYKYFNNKLDMIISAIQSGSSEDVLNAINQLNSPIDKINANLTDITALISKIDGKDFNIKDVKVDFDVNNYASTVSQEINNVLVKVFIPGDTYIDNKYTEINVEMENKLGYQQYTNFFDDIKEIKDAKPTNITINTSNITNMFSGSSGTSGADASSEITLINFDIYYKYKDEVDKIIRGIMFILLLVFNIRHIYILIRGSDMLGGG